MSQKLNHNCPFCSKNFLSEDDLSAHQCSGKKRMLEYSKKVITGAYSIYKKWHKKRGMGAPSIYKFAGSRYFNAFVEFYEWYPTIGVPCLDAYIDFLVKRTLMPFMWTSMDIYYEYVRWFRENTTPEEHYQISLKTVYYLKEIFNCELRNVFDELEFDDMIRIITAMKLSPWFLLSSVTFLCWLKSQSTFKVSMFDTLIDRREWESKIREQPEQFKEFLQRSKSLGL